MNEQINQLGVMIDKMEVDERSETLRATLRAIVAVVKAQQKEIDTLRERIEFAGKS